MGGCGYMCVSMYVCVLAVVGVDVWVVGMRGWMCGWME